MINDYELKKKKIHELLECLGYKSYLAMEFYSEWILEIMNDIENVESRRDIYNCREYLKNMKNGLSLYYYNLVREGMWLGVKSFHLMMEDMVDNIDYEKSDSTLVSKIYGNIDYSIDYAENAFLLASYLLGKKKCDEIEFNKPMIRKLDSMKNVLENYR